MKPGDTVILPCDKNDHLYDFYCEGAGIPSKLIIHGSVKVNKTNKGTVVSIYKRYVIVKYVDHKGETVQLGFLPSTLKLVEEPSDTLFKFRDL